jgi:osmotically-inducible protein OsmY
MMLYVLFAAAGAALAYFFDPQSGRRRRHVARDKTVSFFRRKGRRAARAVASETYGLAMKATHRRERADKPQPNDATLVQKVESEVFRDPSIPKGRINVNAENGVVFLRGEVDSPALLSSLEKRTLEVQGVRAVENLLRLQG